MLGSIQEHSEPIPSTIDFPGWVHEWWGKRCGYSGKSVHGVEYNFYHDVLASQLGRSSDCLIANNETGLESLSYEMLDQRVAALCCSWIQQGLAAGFKVVIVSGTGLNHYVALLAGLRLGLVISLIEATGPYALNNDLSLLAPDYVFIDYALRSWLAPEFERKCLNTFRSEEGQVIPEYAYPLGAPVLKLLTSFAEGPHRVVTMTSEQLFTSLIRDGQWLLALSPEQRVILAGDGGKSFSPLLELYVMLSGACLYLFSPNVLKTQSESLLRHTSSWIFLDDSVRQALTKSGDMDRIAGKVMNWVIPITSYHPMNWRDFIAQIINHGGVAHIAAGEGALGGMMAVSPDIKNMTTLQSPIPMKAVPGCDCYLGNLAQPEAETQTGTGRLCLRLEDSYRATPFLMREGDDECWFYLGLYPPGRQGAVYPASMVVQLLEQPNSWHVCLEVPSASGENRVNYFLLAFCDDRPVEVLHDLVLSQLGPAALPDRILKYDIVPRMNEMGEVNAQWCLQLFMVGEFDRRVAHPFYSNLSQLKKELLVSRQAAHTSSDSSQG